MIRATLTLIYLLFFSFFTVVSATEMGGQANLPSTDYCARYLGRTILDVDGPESVSYNLVGALGNRGYLGQFPAKNARTEAHAQNQGVFWWGHSFGIQPSIEEARKLDIKEVGTGQIMFLISDISTADLEETYHPNTSADEENGVAEVIVSDAELARRREVLRARFRQIFVQDAAKMIYFVEATPDFALHEFRMDSVSKTQRLYFKGTDQLVPRVARELDREAALPILDPQEMEWFTIDSRGRRFYQSGWTFPPVRGMVYFDATFARDNNGKLVSKTIREAMKQAYKLVKSGYRITFNENFRESLDAARDQVHEFKKDAAGVRKGKANSRYEDKTIYNVELEKFEQGRAFSVEVRDPDGKLLAGVLGTRQSGEIVSMDTIFYKLHDNGSYYNLAKIAGLCGMYRLHEAGINVVDTQMVTPFAGSLKAEYYPSLHFLELVNKNRGLPSTPVDFVTSFVPDESFGPQESKPPVRGAEAAPQIRSETRPLENVAEGYRSSAERRLLKFEEGVRPGSLVTGAD